MLPALAARSWRKLTRPARALDDDSPDEELHRVRVLTKRARYAAEAVAPALGSRSAGRQAARFAGRAADVQDVLGELQDSVVAAKTIQDFALEHRHDGPLNLATGRMLERESRRHDAARAAFAPAWRQLGRKKLRSWLQVDPVARAPIQAAGGVVWRVGEGENGGQMEVAIIHRPRYDDWSLPKGKLAPGESHIEGAVREVHEETGYRVQPGRSLGEVRYLKESGGGAREKVVHYWAMRAISGGVQPQPGGRPAGVADGRRGARAGHARHRPRGAGAVCAAARDDRLGAAGAPRERRQPRRLERGRPAAAAGRDRPGPGRRAGAAAVPVRGRRHRDRRPRRAASRRCGR